MLEIPGKVVIRTYAPARRGLILGSILVVTLASLYLSFEYGRYRAGYDRVAAFEASSALQKQVKRLEADNREQRIQIAAQDTARLGQGKERAEVSRTIGELQAQVARQAQDLAFYRGIVGKNAEEPAVKIQQFRVLSQQAAGRYTMRIVLGRPVRLEDVINGTIAVTVEGSDGENVAAYELAKLAPDKKRDLKFSFRYLQTIEQDLQLPEQFKPLRITVETRANRGLSPVRETFLWTPDTT